jgi:hypothetical protein
MVVIGVDAISSGPLTYEEARDLAADPDRNVRQAVAVRTDVAPEILYFLAGDADVGVRTAVAANPTTPVKADLRLADDPEDSVRGALAAKVGFEHRVGRSLADTSSIARDLLNRLTRDRVARVRAVIAQALKDVANADPEVINRLARDADIIVAAPILEFSPIPTDADLLEIITNSPIHGAMAAIARRSFVDAKVTEAIIATNDPQAITHLLKNSNAQIQESTLDSLIERSVHHPTWQEPLVYRPELNERSAQRLAEVVAVHLLDRILARKDLPEEAVRAVARVVGQRLKEQPEQEIWPSCATVDERYAPLIARAESLHAEGHLDEIALMVALLTDRTDELIAGLAVRAGQRVGTILEMVAAQSSKAVCALAWAAGLSAVFALELQVRLAGIAMSQALRPRDDGGYALREAELRWQLELFTNPGL